MEDQDPVVLGVPECSETPGGVWCSVPIGNTTTNTTHEELRAELDQRWSEKLAAISRRHEKRARQRRAFAQNRQHGLQQRHAWKLLRMEGNQ